MTKHISRLLVFICSLYGCIVIADLPQVSDLPAVLSDGNPEDDLYQSGKSFDFDVSGYRVSGVAGCCIGKHPLNQNRVIITNQQIAVFEGQGPHGHDIANCLAEQSIATNDLKTSLDNVRAQRETHGVWKDSSLFLSSVKIDDSGKLTCSFEGDCFIACLPHMNATPAEDFSIVIKKICHYGGVLEDISLASGKFFSYSQYLELNALSQTLQFKNLSKALKFYDEPRNSWLWSVKEPDIRESDCNISNGVRLWVYTGSLGFHPYEIIADTYKSSPEEGLKYVTEVMKERAINMSSAQGDMPSVAPVASVTGAKKTKGRVKHKKGMVTYFPDTISAFSTFAPPARIGMTGKVYEAISSGWLLPHDPDGSLALVIIDIVPAS